MHKLYNRQNKAISIWLGIMCIAIVSMIFIGGLTRLTNSGLSMTEWHPVSGIVPPTDYIGWSVEFNKYKKSPEYKKLNVGMSLEEFKSIYMLEFIHRIAGRVTALIYLLPLIFFLIRGDIRGNGGIYIFALFLLALQGFMGWYMVKSGLLSTPHVSHYRLAIHLMLAVFLYITMFWQLMKNAFDMMLVPTGTKLGPLSLLCFVSILLVLVQMVFGAFVAGLKAGLVYNSFPMMGGSFIPHEISNYPLSMASFGEPVFVQFIHRMISYLIFIVICIFCLYVARLGNSHFLRVAMYVFFALILQISLGVLTLLYHVPILLALFHQLGAIILLSCLLWAYFLIQSAK